MPRNGRILCEEEHIGTRSDGLHVRLDIFNMVHLRKKCSGNMRRLEYFVPMESAEQ
jgi:hypothetical protein